MTLTPKLNGPPAVGGVPVSEPVALSESQAGSAGLVAAQVNPVPVPPEAASACEYVAVASALGKVEDVVMVGPAVMVSVRAALALWLFASVT